MSDSIDWVLRLRRAFGSPNLVGYMELCGWGRFMGTMYTWGEPVPGAYMPDLDNAGCVLYWGYNPSVSRLAHATATTAALRRGAKLVMVDPRRAGLASKADHWLRVRPGTDAALALSITHVMIENGWYDTEFVERWTNASWQVRADTGELLAPAAAPPDGVPTRRVWDLIIEGCAGFAPDVAEQITGVPAGEIIAVARLLWDTRPVAFYTWSGLEQHSNATQTVRAIGQLYALTGCIDAPGGNILFTPAPANPIDGMQLLPAEQRGKAIGVQERPLGPARFEFVTGEDFYQAALDGIPYRARALVNFGANLVMAHGDSARGRDALGALDFFVHTDLFMSPTAEQADVVLPATSAWEAEALRVGFETGQDAQSTVQLRRPLVAPRGEARSDLRIIFDLAVALGLGEQFFGGDIEAAWQHQLAPSGIGLDQLRAAPEGIRLPLQTVHRKYERRGFRTPSRVVELYSETLRKHGYPPLPTYDEPSLSPLSRPDLAARYPLILTCAKSLFLRDPAPRDRQPARIRARAPRRAAPRDCGGSRHRRRGLGAAGDPQGERPRAGQVQYQPPPGCGVRPARLVAAGLRAWPAGLSGLRRGQRQPQPRAQPGTERPDQRQLAAARLALRSRAGQRSTTFRLTLPVLTPAHRPVCYSIVPAHASGREWQVRCGWRGCGRGECGLPPGPRGCLGDHRGGWPARGGHPRRGGHHRPVDGAGGGRVLPAVRGGSGLLSRAVWRCWLRTGRPAAGMPGWARCAWPARPRRGSRWPRCWQHGAPARPASGRWRRWRPPGPRGPPRWSGPPAGCPERRWAQTGSARTPWWPPPARGRPGSARRWAYGCRPARHAARSCPPAGPVPAPPRGRPCCPPRTPAWSPSPPGGSWPA